MPRLIPLLALSAALAVSGCSHYKFPWVYRIDVEQGNIVDEDKLAQLEVGMTQNQVRYLLGSPMIRDTFDQSRWDYYYSHRSGKGQFNRSRLTLRFNGNNLAEIKKHEYDETKLNY